MKAVKGALWCALGACAINAPLAHAQAGERAKPPATLGEVLAKSYWNPQARGPLLAIGAEKVNLRPDEQGLELAPNGGYRPETIASAFGYRAVRLPTLTVLAPSEMAVLNTDFKGKPDPWAELAPAERMDILLRTLNEDQWKALCSPRGLGRDNLEGPQRDLFLTALPPKMSLQKFPIQPDGSVLYSDEHFKANPPRDLTTSDKLALRLRLTKRTYVSVPTTSDVQGLESHGTSASLDKAGNITYRMDTNDFMPVHTVYGAKIKEIHPNRLKPGHLNFEAPVFAQTVRLQKTQTVAELLDNLSQQTGVGLHADGRLTRLSVTALGDEAGAKIGDVLKSLCWSVCGTWRKVGPDYVLTYDIEGLASKEAKIKAWREAGSLIKRYLETTGMEQAKRIKPLQWATFAPQDPFALPPEFTARVEETRTTRHTKPGSDLIPVAQLPPALRQPVAEAIDRYNNSKRASEQPLLSDRVRVQTGTKLVYLLASGEEVEVENPSHTSLLFLLGINSFFTALAEKEKPSPVALNAMSERCALLWNATPGHTGQDWDTIAKTARAKGIKELWVRVGADPKNDADILTPALVAGKKHGLSVFVQVPVMVAPASPPGQTAPPFPIPDMTVMQATGTNGEKFAERMTEWLRDISLFLPKQSAVGVFLRLDQPQNLQWVLKRIARLGKTPGVAGLILSHLLPPGYIADPYNNPQYEEANAVGYTPEARLAFLRTSGYDPVDFSSTTLDFRASLYDAHRGIPFFGALDPPYTERPDGKYGPDPKVPNPRFAWNQYRHAQALPHLVKLHGLLRAELPRTPLLVMAEGSRGNVLYIGAWEKADKPPLLPPVVSGGTESWDADRIAQAARASSETLIDHVDFSRLQLSQTISVLEGFPAPPAKATEVLKMLGYHAQAKAKKKPNWSGLVLDFGAMPASDVADCLSDVPNVSKP